MNYNLTKYISTLQYASNINRKFFGFSLGCDDHINAAFTVVDAKELFDGKVCVCASRRTGATLNESFNQSVNM
tara:strand:- start:673 stop:891 length:219 start_codon:yes stop_codon:yes gene_type:complete